MSLQRLAGAIAVASLLFAAPAPAANYLLPNTGPMSMGDLVDDYINPALQALGSRLPGGRLSLTSGVAVTEADVIGASTVYVVSIGHLFTSIYDGANWIPRTFANNATVILDSTGHTANTNYDIWECWTGSAVAYGTGPSWNTGGGSNTARGTGAGSTAVDYSIGGRGTNAVALVIRNNSVNSSSYSANRCNLMGTIRTTLAGQTEDSLAKRFVSNAINWAPRALRAADGLTNYTYSTASFRQAGASSLNQVAVVLSVSGRQVSLEGFATAAVAGAGGVIVSGFGLDSTTSASTLAFQPNQFGASNNLFTLPSKFSGYPGLGYHFVARLEYGAAAGTTWYSNSGLSAVMVGQVPN
jgi:hypothetical protein